MLASILLDGDWTCETEGNLKSIASLSAYQLDALQNNPGGAWFRHIFSLEATDYCVNYVLQFDSIPAGTAIFVNNERLNLDSASPFNIEITAYVALGDNELAFYAEAESVGSFEGVCLQPVPCE